MASVEVRLFNMSTRHLDKTIDTLIGRKSLRFLFADVMMP